jgi:membrane-associated phospholipid phosphatase
MDALSANDVRASAAGHPDDTDRPRGGTVFEARRGGPADRLGRRRSDHSPTTAFAIVAVAGLVVLAAVIVGIGLLLVHVLLNGGLGRWDASVNEWFVAQRTTALNSVTRWGSDLGATFTVVGTALVAAIALAIARRWDAVRFIIVSLVLEVSVFLISTILVDRPRPDVHRLDISPPTSSYPSGHTAAAIVLYVGLALVVSALTRNAILRTIAWILAVALPIVVGLSRLYRGMHHPTDVLASVILGIGALLFGLLAARTASAVSDRRTRAASEA